MSDINPLLRGHDDDEYDVNIGDDVETEVESKDRKARRKERGEIREENDRLRAEAKHSQDRIAKLEGYARGLDTQALLRGSTQQRQQQQGPNPYEAEKQRLYQQQEDLNELYQARQQSGNLDPRDAAQMRERARGLAERVVRVQMAEHGQGQPRAQNIDPQQVAMQAIQTTLRANNQDVYSNPTALAWSKAKYAQYKAEGATDSQELHDNVMDETREQYKMARRSERPSQGQRDRLSGFPRGGTGKGSEPRKDVVRMTKAYRAMADEAYGDIEPDEKKRHQRWANGPGRRLMEAERERDRSGERRR